MIRLNLVCFVLGCFVLSCSGGNNGKSGDDSTLSDGDTDADSDTNSDGDADGDGDGDSDADADGDGDSDADGDGDGDSDGDGDGDSDADGDSDSDVDSDADTDSDMDSDTDTQTNTDSDSEEDLPDISDTASAGNDSDANTDSDSDSCAPYQWPGYDPDLNWTFGEIDIDPESFEVYQGCDSSLVAGTVTSGWWSFIWGHDRNPDITDAQIQQVLDGLNADLGYIRDMMGWPPDRMVQDGYYSSVYLYGSGLCTDNASNTEQGGWQSAIGPYPMVLISWAPIVNYDRGGITHEAIHAMVQGAPGGTNKAHWFNEGGNTWIQQQLYAQRDGSYGVGFLDGAPFIAPHQPVECYSGWLIDGSFGGPDAEGVGNENWRRYLGGTQYASVFSHFLQMYLSPGANAWIWQQAQPRNILETLSTGLGDAQTRHLIMEYKARQALVDFGPWRDSILGAINGEWGSTIKREIGTADIPDYLAVSYAPTTTSGKTVTPDEYTLPGWSGGNQIPFSVSGNEVKLNFNPEAEDMRMQLAYWATDGTAVYSRPVESGEVCLRMDKSPQNDVVIAIISNTDYVFTGDAMRFEKYGYTVDMVDGVSGTADRSGKYFLK